MSPSSESKGEGGGVESTTLLIPGGILPPSPPASTDPMWH